MDHDLELIIPNPGNIWKFDLYNFPISWKYWIFFYFLLSWKYWKLKSPLFSIILEIRAAGGRLLLLGFPGLDISFGTLFLEKCHCP